MALVESRPEYEPIEMLFLSHEDVLATGLDMRSVVATITDVFRLHAAGQVNLPDKLVLDLGERERGRINAMPAWVGGDINLCGIKWIAGFPKNPARYGIPRASAVLVLNDADNGLPLCIMDGTYISAMRTGAVSGVGARYLARRGAKVVTMIGCGVQARTQLLAVEAVLGRLALVKLYDLRFEAAAELAAWCQEAGLSERAEACRTAEEAVRGSDVISTVTVADEPIVKGRWLEPGSLLMHVGSYREEDDEAILQADRLVVDDWDHVLKRGTQTLAKLYLDGALAKGRAGGEIVALPDIVTGAAVGRRDPGDRVFFCPIGLGTEDVAVAGRVYAQALARGLGRKLVLRRTHSVL